MTEIPDATGTAEASFGRQLRLRREAAGLTLGEFSLLVHYSVSYLSRIENGLRPPPRHLAERCDKALDADGVLLALVPERPGRGDEGSARPAAGQAGPSRSAPGSPAWTSRYGAEFDALIRQGDAAQAAGKMLEAGRRYLRAYRRADGMPRAQAEAVIRLARRWSDPGQVDKDVIQLINTALHALRGDGDGGAALLRLRLNAHLAKKLSFSVSQDTAIPGARPEQGVALAQRTLRQMPAECPDEVRCEVLTECRWALFDYTPAASLLPMSRSLHDVALRVGSAHLQGEALSALAVDQLRVGQIPAALATVEQHRSYAGRTPSAIARWQQSVFDTLLDLWRGNFDSAAEWIFGESQAIVASLEADMEIPVDTLRQTRLGQAFWLLREQGRMAELFTSGMVGGVERYGYSPIWRAALTLALCETDRWTDAADQMAAFAEDTERFGALPPSGWAVPTLALLAEACAVLGRSGRHQSQVADLVPLIDAGLAGHHAEIALAGWPTVLIGPVARARGLLALAAADGPLALERFGYAVRLAGPSRPQMARLRADRARVLLRYPALGAEGEAAALLADSLSAARELGMARLAADVRALQEDAAADQA